MEITIFICDWLFCANSSFDFKWMAVFLLRRQEPVLMSDSPVYRSKSPNVRLCENWGLRRCAHRNRRARQIFLHSAWLSHFRGWSVQAIRVVLVVAHSLDYCDRPQLSYGRLCPCSNLVSGCWNNYPWLLRCGIRRFTIFILKEFILPR